MYVYIPYILKEVEGKWENYLNALFEVFKNLFSFIHILITEEIFCQLGGSEEKTG